MKTIPVFELRDLLNTGDSSRVSFLGSLELPDLLSCTLLPIFHWKLKEEENNFCWQCFLLLDEQLLSWGKVTWAEYSGCRQSYICPMPGLCSNSWLLVPGW